MTIETFATWLIRPWSWMAVGCPGNIIISSNQSDVEGGDRFGRGQIGMEGLRCPMCRLAQERLSTRPKYNQSSAKYFQELFQL